MKFKIGDMARVKYTRTGSALYWHPGMIVTITVIENGTIDGAPYECEVELPSGKFGSVLFEQLEPLVPDAVKWSDIEAEFGWNPTKELVNEV